MIEVDEQFDVPAPPETVWRLLADPYQVVGCVPGAAIARQNDDGSLETTLGIKFGPVNIAFQAHAELVLEPELRRGRLTARGKDKQGGARFQASATFSVAAAQAGPGSVVSTRGEVELSGRLASLIESGAQIVVKRMSAEFASCLSTRCAAAAARAEGPS
jgi:carbon monoxide dehydrogenase subunit G